MCDARLTFCKLNLGKVAVSNWTFEIKKSPVGGNNPGRASASLLNLPYFIGGLF
jgi:hypothetical protein